MFCSFNRYFGNSWLKNDAIVDQEKNSTFNGAPGNKIKKSDSLSSEFSNFVILDFLPYHAIQIHGQARSGASGQENEKGSGCMITGYAVDTGIDHYPYGDDREK